MRSIRVLVVEDDDDCRETIDICLSDAGFEVSTASDGVAGLRFLSEGMVPDVILLDLRLPQLDGWTLLDLLSEHPRLCNIPVVVLSGSVFAPTSTQKARHFLRKPIDEALLTATLRDVAAASVAS